MARTRIKKRRVLVFRARMVRMEMAPMRARQFGTGAAVRIGQKVETLERNEYKLYYLPWKIVEHTQNASENILSQKPSFQCLFQTDRRTRVDCNEISITN